MLKQNKWELWWDNLDSRTKQWLEKQPIYTSKDYDKAVVIAFAIGVVVGLIF